MNPRRAFVENEVAPTVRATWPYSTVSVSSSHRTVHAPVEASTRWISCRVSDGDRTRDISRHKAALYQLSYTHQVLAAASAREQTREQRSRRSLPLPRLGRHPVSGLFLAAGDPSVTAPPQGFEPRLPDPESGVLPVTPQGISPRGLFSAEALVAVTGLEPVIFAL